MTLHSQTSQQEYLFNEWNDYFKGVYELPTHNAKALNIYNQLANYSNMLFYIRYTQTFMWGQAHRGGVILLDYSALAKDEEILAFIMAHEWGHEALGHQPNIYNPYGNVWQFAKGQTADEDAADYYSGRFLATYGYDIDIVTDFLENLPVSSQWDSHSTGRERAEIVLEGYSSISNSSPQYRTIKVNCIHPIHSDGDVILCIHAQHPEGDLIPCNHTCYDPFYGNFPCHQNHGVTQCVHPLHYNDGFAPCIHPMHSYDEKTVQN